MAQVRKVLGPETVVRLRKAGFTVNASSASPGADTITYSGPTAGGGISGILARLLVGGKATVARLRKLGIWSTT